MAKCILRNGRVISDYGLPYFVAEMNSSHNGNIETAKKMIDAACKIGCDAVKFQSWSAQSLYSKNYYDENPLAKRMVSKFALSPDKLKELSAYCRERKIDFSSTPYSEEELDFLVDECKADFVKVASMDINNYNFLKKIAKKNIAIILSTGMAGIDEIKKAVSVIEEAGNTNLCVLHCVTEYPVDESNVNLRNLQKIREEIVRYPVGYSDHTIGCVASMGAVAMGAALIEKHFTLDNKKIGWDNNMACEPDEFEKMIQLGRNMYNTLGNAERNITEKELEYRKKMRRSIVASRDLQKGDIIGIGDLDAKRPEMGIGVDKLETIIGKKLLRDINKDEIIFENDFI